MFLSCVHGFWSMEGIATSIVATLCLTSLSALCREIPGPPHSYRPDEFAMLVIYLSTTCLVFHAQAGETSFVWVLQIMVPGPPHYAFVCYFTPETEK